MARHKLLYKPDEYAKDAIVCITEQLKTARSEKKRAKLVAKLNMWKKTLHLLQDANA